MFLLLTENLLTPVLLNLRELDRPCSHENSLRAIKRTTEAVGLELLKQVCVFSSFFEVDMLEV